MALVGIPSYFAVAGLHQGDAARAVDGAQPQRAVSAGAGEEDADGLIAAILGQRAQEGVDGHALAARFFRDAQLQRVVEDRHVAVGRDHIDAIRHHLHLVLRLDHRHGRGALQDFGEQAGVARVEVRHQHEGHTAVGLVLRKNCSKASSPPAEAPTPTMGKLAASGFFEITSVALGGILALAFFVTFLVTTEFPFHIVPLHP
jgi:hypothetical protein